uniref:hypothetical protein n=1 Tax=Thaumasiovibrio occultus TaxID=1891184 RepID=UPI000B35ED20|nr:hypothetical protein [Thaumasiovibrio occultus]
MMQEERLELLLTLRNLQRHKTSRDHQAVHQLMIVTLTKALARNEVDIHHFAHTLNYVSAHAFPLLQDEISTLRSVVDRRHAKEQLFQLRDTFQRGGYQTIFTDIAVAISSSHLQISKHHGGRQSANAEKEAAIAKLIGEFFSASFSEIRSLYSKNKQTDTLLENVMGRVEKVTGSLLLKWQQEQTVLDISTVITILAHLETTLVKIFVMTGTRTVRFVRESYGSLLNALELFLASPATNDVTHRANEALKIIFGTGTIAYNVLCEESVDTLYKENARFADLAMALSPIIYSGLTLISSSFIVYIADKLELLDIVEIKDNQFILDSLSQDNQDELKRCNDLALELEHYFTA